MISVIVPIYNAKKYLHQCIDSILNQTYSDLEVILVNDGSNDGSKEICDEYLKLDDRIKVIHKPNGGVSSARNAGVAFAKGDYIGFVDSDDCIVEDMYEHLLNNATKYQCPIASMGYIFTNRNAKVNDLPLEIHTYENKELIHYYLSHMFDSSHLEQLLCNKIYKRELFENITFPTNQIYEDMYTNLLLLDKANKMVVSNKIGYLYFYNSDSITNTHFKEKNMDLIKVCNEIIDFVEEKNDDTLTQLAIAIKENNYLSLLIRIAESKESFEEYKNGILKELNKNKYILKYHYIPKIQTILISIACISYPLFKIIVNLFYKAFKKRK